MSNYFVTPWTVPHQASLSMGFPRQEYWSGLPFPSPGGLPDPGIKLASHALQEDSLLLSHWEVQESYENLVINLNSRFPGVSALNYLPVNVGDTGLIPGSGRPPGEGNGNPLQYCCLENPMDRGAWWGTVHGVTKSWTRLSAHTHAHQIYQSQIKKS